MSIVFPSLFSLVFIAIGAGILGYAFKVAAKAQRSLNWPFTDGQIAHSAVLMQTNRTGNTSAAPTYKADISYRYKVNGTSYSSSRIALLDLGSNTSLAQSLVDRYPDGSSVRVYYNPADFSEALLEPGSTGGVKFLYLVGGIFAAGGLFFLLMSLTGRVHVQS